MLDLTVPADILILIYTFTTIIWQLLSSLDHAKWWLALSPIGNFFAIIAKKIVFNFLNNYSFKWMWHKTWALFYSFKCSIPTQNKNIQIEVVEIVSFEVAI